MNMDAEHQPPMTNSVDKSKQIQIGDQQFNLIYENRAGWDPEMFITRYNEVLDRFDYVVGDWGYSMLRLKGFYEASHPKANHDSSIAVLQDYINEYCNFGCPYFVLRRTFAPGQNQQHASHNAGDTDLNVQDVTHEDVHDDIYNGGLEDLDE